MPIVVAYIYWNLLFLLIRLASVVICRLIGILLIGNRKAFCKVSHGVQNLKQIKNMFDIIVTYWVLYLFATKINVAP